MKRKISNNFLAMSLAEIIVATLIGSMILTAITITYYWSARAAKKGFEKSEAQQALNTTLDQLLKDLRMIGANVNITTCGVEKNRSILVGTDNTLTVLGDFIYDLDGIERLHYVLERNNTCLARVIYEQQGTGVSSTWINVVSRKNMIGNADGAARLIIRQVDKNNNPSIGFRLVYLDANNLALSTPLTPDSRILVKRVNILIAISNKDGIELTQGANSTGILRNFVED